jgi:hypothetical protein
MEREHTEVEQNNSSINKEYRVINIDKNSYYQIKEYCDKNSLKISKWVSQEILNIIKNKNANE